jgi:hypothetical protein
MTARNHNRSAVDNWVAGTELQRWIRSYCSLELERNRMNRVRVRVQSSCSWELEHSMGILEGKWI